MCSLVRVISRSIVTAEANKAEILRAALVFGDNMEPQRDKPVPGTVDAAVILKTAASPWRSG
jgi:hypothetical protein